MDVEKGLGFVEQKWYSAWGLVGCAVLIAGLVALFVPENHLKARIITLAVLLMALLAVWWYSRQTPQSKKGRVGIAICIDVGSTAESRKVRDHFVRTLRLLVKSGQMREKLDVLVVPDHLAAKITDGEEAEKLRQRMRAHFLLYGNVSLGNHGGKPTHLLRMVGVVQHAMVDAEVKTALVQEFTELLPQNVNVDAAADLAGFEFISRISELCAKYVLAVASAMSGQLGFSAGLLEDVIRETADPQPAFPAITKIRERAPIRLAEINCVRAAAIHQRWVRNPEPDDLRTFVACIDAIPDDVAIRVGAAGLKAIRAFVEGRDVQCALNWVENDRHEEDPAWHFSRAFLYAYLGDLKRATQSYLKIKELDLKSVEAMTQVDEFLYWLLGEEPDKIQLYYCLGLIAWRIRGDHELARKEFIEFLRLCPADKFVKDREIVERWLQEMPTA